ncbi:MAG: PAS domain S-box protein, partial [Desulfovibrionaceae bacterium]|nr:PAS domain S-box protein [Desulfovibrionaceae bacterium]
MPGENIPTYRILALDDERAMRTLYRDILCLEREVPATLEALFSEGGAPSGPVGREYASFDLSLFAEAEEAVRAVQDSIDQGRPFAVALIDVRLASGRDGVWTAERIRELDPNIEIVMATAYTDVTLNELNLRIPPPEKLLYLQKPFRPQELRQLALSLCSKWDAECRLRELNQTLAQKVEARTRDLDQANRKLRRDIDQRIKVLQDLRASEEKYRLLFEEDVAGNFVADAQGRILSCNNAFARMFGFAGQEEARAFEVFGPGLGSPPGAAVLEMVKARGRIENLETSFGRGRDKVLALCSCEAAIRDDGRGVEEIRGYFFDITERKRLE